MDLEGGAGGVCPLFCNHLFFLDNFEELEIVFIEVKLIINNGIWHAFTQILSKYI